MSPSSLLRHWVPVLVVACVGGCATPTAQGGLSNAPDENRSWGPEDRGEDAIANGRGSCPPSMKREDDPLPNRRPRCVDTRPSSGSTVIVPAALSANAPPPPPTVLR